MLWRESKVWRAKGRLKYWTSRKIRAGHILLYLTKVFNLLLSNKCQFYFLLFEHLLHKMILDLQTFHYCFYQVLVRLPIKLDDLHCCRYSGIQ